MTARPADRVTAPTRALQAALAAEHAALWVYGVLGGQTSESGSPELFTLLRTGYQEHRSRRDELTSMLRADGAEPVPAQVGYRVPDDLSSPRAVQRTARQLEAGCAATYAALVAHTVDERRRRAITWLTEAAGRPLAFRGSPEIFPGAAELADR